MTDLQEEKKTMSFFPRFLFRKVKRRRNRVSEGHTTYPCDARSGRGNIKKGEGPKRPESEWPQNGRKTRGKEQGRVINGGVAKNSRRGQRKWEGPKEWPKRGGGEV